LVLEDAVRPDATHLGRGENLRILLHAAATLLLVACGARSGGTAAGAKPSPDGTCLEPNAEGCSLNRVPIEELVAQPDKWRGRRVAVEGYLHLEPDHGELYPSEDDYRHRNRRAALLTTNFLRGVLGPTCDCTEKDVVIVGMYDPSDKGSSGRWGGAVKDIEKVQVQPE
jgi:hypothetical protein